MSTCHEFECLGHVTEGAELCGLYRECYNGWGDVVYEMTCEGATCTCLVDGVQDGECDNDICADELTSFELVEKWNECCGF